MLLVNDAGNVTRVGDKYIIRRKVRVTDSRFVQLCRFRDKVRSDL